MRCDEPTPFSRGVMARAWLFIVQHSSFILFLAVVAVLGVNFRLCMREGWWDPAAGKNGSDFTALYSAGELARHSEDIYDYARSSTPRRPFIYPPMFAVFPMAPLSLLPHNAALAVYWVLNILMLFASLWLLRAVLWPSPCPLTQEEGEHPAFWRRPETGLLLAVLVCGRFLNSNLRLGNANMYILFLLALTLYLLANNRGLWAGLSVALAMAFKVTPGLFGLYLLWSRRGKALLGGALGVALFFVLLPGVVLGFAQNWEMLNAFARHASGAVSGQRDREDGESSAIVVGWKHPPRESHTKAGETPAVPAVQPSTRLHSQGQGETQAVGVSLRGAMQKLLSPSVALNHRPESEDRTVNVLNLTAQQAARVADVLSLVLLALTIWLTARVEKREERREEREESKAESQAHSSLLTPHFSYELILSVGLLASAMLLISPLTRKAHLVVLLIPVAALIALLQQGKLTGAARRWAWVSLLVLGLHGVVFSADIVGARLSEVVQALGATTLSVLLLYAATAVALRKHEGRA